MTKISAIIITFNEEKNIKRCLESLIDVVDEIIVVDSLSSDRTENICKTFGVKFFIHAWEGYSGSKNFANKQATHEYIFSIDADEALSTELKKTIVNLKKTGLKGAYSVNRITNYCGNWVKHGGWYPDIKLRIWNKNEGEWKGALHEDIAFKKEPESIELLKGDLLHYSYYSIDGHYAQVEKFTDIAANDLVQSGKRGSYLKLIFNPVIKFIKDYIFKLGFLDGKTGFTIARISAYATFRKYYKIIKLSKN